MTYWLAIQSRTNAELMFDRAIWGVPEIASVEFGEVKTGDKGVVFVGRQEGIDLSYKQGDLEGVGRYPAEIDGAFEVVSAVYRDDMKIFEPPPSNIRELYPLRVMLDGIRIFREPLEFLSLIPQLSFMVNKELWEDHIKGKVLLEIPGDDYELIMRKGCGK